ncbi:MAG: hypothetical protein PHS59_17015 [Paludibacter sp.]|nr:hypothetical protein [Paludibacter sp.]
MIKEKMKKGVYFSPKITRIRLDNEISLVMESDPPVGDGETVNLIRGRNNSDPFNTKIA